MSATELEFYLKAVTFVAGAAFFGWKLLTGWLIINMNVTVSLDREHLNSASDYLSVVITLEKGSIDSVWLNDVTAKVRTENGIIIELITFDDELKWLAVDPQRKKIAWDGFHPEGKKIMLSPTETFQLSSFAEVPRDKPVMVDIAVLGTRKFWRPGFQWRATGVSLPKSKNQEEDARH